MGFDWTCIPCDNRIVVGVDGADKWTKRREHNPDESLPAARSRVVRSSDELIEFDDPSRPNARYWVGDAPNGETVIGGSPILWRAAFHYQN